MQIDPLKQLYTDFMVVIKQCVIKYKTEADKYETLETKKASDAYIKAYRGEDVFETYYRYDKQIIAEIMHLTDEDKIEFYHLNRNEIPYNYRGILLKKQRALIISEYEEMNNYYRCLNGLPNYEESDIDFFYVDEPIARALGISYEIPIHQLPEHHIATLQSIGYINKLITSYPNKKYLNYLTTTNKIDIVTARTARNFGVIRIPTGISNVLKDSFSTIYDQCREYFMSCIYIPEYKNIIDYYDNFIAMCIMIMTMYQVITRTLKESINRNFYDEYCVRILFETYKVPYNPYMDSSTRSQLIQNLNLLIQSKGTNKVVCDIASILGYDRIKIYKYYLMKSQKFDVNGFPIESFTVNENTGEKTYDYQSMFDVYFKKVAIDDLDVYKALADSSNNINYQEIVENDPYWVEDGKLQKELYESEYNYVESKYMGVSISYRLSRILFENVYLLKMIFEKKDEIPSILLDLPKISEYNRISLFDAIVTLCAMTCKQNNLKGEIMMRPSGILHVMGFNFLNDFDTIREEILSDPYLDDELLDFFTNSTAYSADRINALYSNYLDLHHTLLEKMTTTQDVRAYQAYKKLYNTVFYTKENQNMFNIGTITEPRYASTFLEYLQYTNTEIYDFIQNTDKETMYVYINHIAQKMTTVINDLKYIGAMSNLSSTMETMLVDLIRFFKSYTTDMLGFDTIYIFDMKPDTLLRFIEHITIHGKLVVKDDFNISYSDSLNFTSTVKYKSMIGFIDKVRYITAGYWIYDNIKFFDEIHKIIDTIHFPDTLTMYDMINNIYQRIEADSQLILKELIDIHSSSYMKENISFQDFFDYTMSIMKKYNFSLYDIVGLYDGIIHKESSFIKCEGVHEIHTSSVQIDKNVYVDLCEFMKTIFNDDIFPLMDVLQSETNQTVSSTCKLTDTYEITYI